MSNVQITVIEVALSDNSKVYNVQVRQRGGGSVLFQAITCTDAWDMAAKFKSAINDHTNDEAEQDAA